MTGFAAEELADLRRWAICGAIVVAAHGVVAAAVVNWWDPVESAEPAAGIVIEIAPVPVAPPQQQTEIPPGPEMVMSDASPDRPVESVEEKPEAKVEQTVEAKVEQKVEEKVASKPVEEPPPEVAPAPDPEVAVELPPPPTVKQEAPQRQEPRPPAPTTSAPQAIPEQTAAVPAAPTQGQPNPNTSSAMPTWKTQIAALLERNKRYPPAAQSRSERGVARVFFSLDRQGRLIDSRVLRSSGAAALDEEALALLRRVQPFPKPPAELAGERVELIVPIRFNLK
jgi:protein TonB